MQSPKIVVCIPAYNEARAIAEVINKAKPFATRIIVCDDGSVDDTAKVAEELGAEVIRHTTNKGYGAAIRTLFQKAKEENADVMVTLDSDGQHDPDQIPEIIGPVLKQGYDIVIGSRFLNESDKNQVPAYRSFGIKTITSFAKLISYSTITDAQSGFRAYSKKAMAMINITGSGMAVSTEILAKARENDLTITEVPVTIIYEIEDTSTHHPVSHGLGVMAAMVQYAALKHPLLFCGIPGLVFLIIAGFFVGLTVNLYSSEGFFSINMAILAIGLGIFGLILIVAGVAFFIMASRNKG